MVKRFGGLVAVDGVSLEVQPNSVTAIIGPNGAGKSTFFKMLAGELHPDAGQIFFKGEDITRRGVTAVAQLGISKSYQITQIFPKLSVEANLTIPALARRRGPFQADCFRNIRSVAGVDEIVRRVMRQVGLDARAAVRADELSYGEKRRLEFGLALATEPELLLLDEPSAGMSPTETQDTVALLRELRSAATIVIVEHDMDVVFGLADRIIVLQDGRIIASGSAEQIRGDPRVQEAYLGDVVV